MTGRWDILEAPEDHEDRRKGSIVLELGGIKQNLRAAELLLDGKAMAIGRLYVDMQNLEATVRTAKRFVREAEAGERMKTPYEEAAIGRQLNIDLNTVTAGIALVLGNHATN